MLSIGTQGVFSVAELLTSHFTPFVAEFFSYGMVTAFEDMSVHIKKCDCNIDFNYGL
jgi:hypothetical protein